MLTMAMNDRARELFDIRTGFAALDSSGGLAAGLRDWADRGLEIRGEILAWKPVPFSAADAPADFGDLTGWESAHTALHLDDFVPVTISDSDGQPRIGPDDQRELLRQGIALAFEIGRLAAELPVPQSIRCVVSANDTNGTFRFHRIRAGESWHDADLDSYESDHVVVLDFQV
ncbi:hypothetical protein ACFVUS_06285 [Nocardia sp. NPDC058058]|uniref:hypothetical protein n=1 Tax=Nocardia sp. NPDC058058 TaxID=3346317 RepID=UPI0036D81F0F